MQVEGPAVRAHINLPGKGVMCNLHLSQDRQVYCHSIAQLVTTLCMTSDLGLTAFELLIKLLLSLQISDSLE